MHHLLHHHLLLHLHDFGLRFEVDQFHVEHKIAIGGDHHLASLRIALLFGAIGLVCRDMQDIFAAHLHLLQPCRETGDHAINLQRRPFALIEHGAVLQLAGIIHQHEIIRRRAGALALRDRFDPRATGQFIALRKGRAGAQPD